MPEQTTEHTNRGATRLVFGYELRRNARRGGYLFASLGIPLIALVLFFLSQASSRANADAPPEPPKVATDSPLNDVRPQGYVDEAGLLVGYKNPQLKAYPDVAAAEAAIASEEIAMYYIIAADYLQTGEISMHFKNAGFNTTNRTFIRNAILAGLAKQPAAQQADATLLRGLQVPRISVEPNAILASGETAKTNEAAQFIYMYVFAAFLFISVFTTSGYLMQSVVEEKSSRMIEVILSSVKPRSLLLGKFLALALLGLIQMAIWGGTIVYIINTLAASGPQAPVPPLRGDQLLLLTVYFILGYLMFAAAFAAIGAMVNNMREGPQFATLITFPSALPLYFIPIIVNAPNSGLPVFFSLFPFSAPLTMVCRILISPVPPLEIALSIGSLILTILALIWLASRAFQVNMLLGGRVASLRDFRRLLGKA
jgi:ABC-2 type transport system permease protein